MKDNEKVGLAKLVQLPAQPCPYCKWPLEATAGIGPGASGKEALPTKGCRGVCSNCLNWLIFDDNLTVRPMEEADIIALTNDQFQDIVEVSKFLRHYQDKGNRRGPVSKMPFIPIGVIHG